MGFFLQRWRSLRTKPLHHVTLHSRDPRGVLLWILWCYSARGEEGCPRPVCPTPTGVYPPRSRVWGGIEERASAWVRSPGYGLSPGIATTAPAPRGGGGGRRPGGVVAYGKRRDRGERRMPPPSAQPPVEMSPGPAYGGEPGEKAGAGVHSPGCGPPRVSPRLPPPEGAGEEAGGRAGWGMLAY